MKKLTYEDEKELVYKIQNGDTEALNTLIECNQGLVGKIAGQYLGLGLEFDDLFQCGNVGLIKAVKRYDPERGTRFGTYAVHWIKLEIRRGLYKEGIIRIPEYRKTQILDCYHYCNEYQKIHKGMQPSLKEISERYKCDKKTAMWLKDGFSFFSLDWKNEAMGITFEKMLGIEDDYENLNASELYKLLKNKVGDLNAYIVWQRVMCEKNYKDITETGLSQESIRQRYIKAIEVIKNDKEIMEYLSM